MGNFECDPNVAQLKDEEFLPTFVGWNKFQICLCIYINMRKLFLYLCSAFLSFASGLFQVYTADGSCEIFRNIRTDLPDYTVS